MQWFNARFQSKPTQRIEKIDIPFFGQLSYYKEITNLIPQKMKRAADKIQQL